MALEVDPWFGSNTGNVTKIKEMTSFQYLNPKSLKGLKKKVQTKVKPLKQIPRCHHRSCFKKKNYPLLELSILQTAAQRHKEIPEAFNAPS